MFSTLVFLGFPIIVCVFGLVSFKFLSILMLLENLNILVLLTSYGYSSETLRVPYLIFMVVATIEVTLALVSLTRLWDSDCLNY